MYRKEIFKRAITAFTFLLIIIFIISYPKKSLSASLEGLDVWVNIVFPSLLPFFIISEVMIRLGFVDFLALLLGPIMEPVFRCPGHGSFVWIMGITSGYPTGARLIASLYKKGDITRIEGQRMLSFCNNSGPLFIIGAIGIGMLGSPKAGNILFLSHLLSSIILGLGFRFYGGKDPKRKASNKRISIIPAFKRSLRKDYGKQEPLGEILGDSIRSSMEAQLLIGGFIILFSVIIEAFIQNNYFDLLTRIFQKNYPAPLGFAGAIKPLAAGILEVTSGCRLLGDITLPMNQKLMTLSFMIGWGGLSIHSQGISFLSKTDLSIGIYLLSKLCHGILSAGITYVILLFSKVESRPAFNASIYSPNIAANSTLLATFYLLSSALFIMAALYFLVAFIRNMGR